MRPIFVDVLVDERLRQQERDAGAGRVERVGVRVAPVVLRDVRRDPRDLRRGHRLRHVGLARGSLVVHGRDDARVVDRPHARHGLVDVAAVVAGGDLDARAVGATARVERRRRPPSSASAWSFSESTGDSKTVISPIFSGGFAASHGAVVPQADGRVVDLLGRGGPARGVAARVVVVAAAHAAATSASAISTASVRARVLDIALFPLRAAASATWIYRIRRASMYIACDEFCRRHLRSSRTPLSRAADALEISKHRGCDRAAVGCRPRAQEGILLP